MKTLRLSVYDSWLVSKKSCRRPKLIKPNHASLQMGLRERETLSQFYCHGQKPCIGHKPWLSSSPTYSYFLGLFQLFSILLFRKLLLLLFSNKSQNNVSYQEKLGLQESASFSLQLQGV